MKLNIELNFDVGDKVIYKGDYFNPSTDEPFMVGAIEWLVTKDGKTKVFVYAESLKKNIYGYPDKTLHSVKAFSNADSKPLFEPVAGYEAHPIDIEIDTKYDFDQEVIEYTNGDIYCMFAPHVLHITKFVYIRNTAKLKLSETTRKDIISSQFMRGYNPTSDERFWLVEEGWNVSYASIVPRLPDDYFDRVWNRREKTRYFSTDNDSRETDFEKLFKNLGILKQARESFDKFMASGSKKKTTKKQPAKKKFKVDSLLEGLSDEEKNELLEKLKQS